MRYELKSIGIWSFVKISFFLNLVLGFVFGIFYALMFGFILAATSSLTPGMGGLPMEDVSIGMLVVIMPFMFAFFMAVFNTIFGLIAIGAYNLICRMTCGLELHFEPVQATTTTLAPPPVPSTAPQPGPPPPPPPAAPPQAPPRVEPEPPAGE
ncbi:MAG: DUF3566 domain-containing protein [candidate division Zixibacteria bacterium]|nr:DUF3566 domain-containing protein [candidate division Zixibacteria bacterium]